VTVEQSIDQMQITGAATAGTHGELARQVRLGAGRESGNLFVPDMNPRDLALAAERVGQTVQAVADDAIDPLDASHR
jgi:hypothetical protein